MSRRTSPPELDRVAVAARNIPRGGTRNAVKLPVIAIFVGVPPPSTKGRIGSRVFRRPSFACSGVTATSTGECAWSFIRRIPTSSSSRPVARSPVARGESGAARRSVWKRDARVAKLD
jgi:hypothetical protein